MIDFELTDSQLSWQRRAREFALRELVPRRGDLDRHNDFQRDLYEKAFAEGFLAISMPREVGGMGLPFLDTLVAVEEIAYGDLGFATSMFVQWLAMGTVLDFGTDEQRQRWIAPMTRSLRFCSFAITEPHAGSAGLQIGTTTARPHGDGFVLNGKKCYITNSPVAEWLAVFGNVEPSPLPPGQSTFSCFLVPRGARGLTVRGPYHKLGQRGSATGEVTLDDVQVERDCLVGAVGQGHDIALGCLNRTRASIGIMGVGVARAARDLAVEFAYHRRTFGNKRLITQQDYRFRLAEMDVQIQAARLLGWRAGWELEHGSEPARYASTSKLFGGNMAAAVTSQAVEMLGGLGYMQEGVVEKLMRDAKLLQIYEGATAVQKLLIAEYAAKREPWMMARER